MNSASVKEKQAREFARYIIDGKTQTEAYKLTHPNSKATDIKMKELASRFARNEEVKTIIEETKKSLKEHTEKKFNISKERVLQELSTIAFTTNEEIREDGTRSIKSQDKLKALEMINKMLGYNEADKVDVELEGNINVNFEGTLNEWSK